jgi:hypothetical protein
MFYYVTKLFEFPFGGYYRDIKTYKFVGDCDYFNFVINIAN